MSAAGLAACDLIEVPEYFCLDCWRVHRAVTVTVCQGAAKEHAS